MQRAFTEQAELDALTAEERSALLVLANEKGTATNQLGQPNQFADEPSALARDANGTLDRD